MVDSNFCDLLDVVVFELVDVVDHLAIVGADSSRHHQVLKLLVVRKRRSLQNNLLLQFNELDWKISRHECPDGHGDIVGVSIFWKGGGNNLLKFM